MTYQSLRDEISRLARELAAAHERVEKAVAYCYRHGHSGINQESHRHLTEVRRILSGDEK